MKRLTRNHLHLALAGFLLAQLFGCAKPSPPVTYYNLAPIVPTFSIPAGSETSPLAVGVGPVIFPESLDRAQMALRINSQSLQFDEFHRWSGSLADDFSKVLLEDLAGQLPKSSLFAIFPWGRHFHPTHRVQVDVLRFDGSLGGDVVLQTRWMITDGEGKNILASSKSVIKTPTGGKEFLDLVTAQSLAVEELAREIAGKIAVQ